MRYPDSSVDSSTDPLYRLPLHAEGCTARGLASTRNKAVFGVGDDDADLMVVGEVPTYHPSFALHNGDRVTQEMRADSALIANGLGEVSSEGEPSHPGLFSQ